MTSTAQSHQKSTPKSPSDGRPRGLQPPRSGLPSRPRSWGLAAVAGLLVVGFGLAGAVLFNRAGDKVSVLEVSSPVAKGQVIERSDVQSVAVAGVPAGISVAQVDSVVGKTAAVDLVPHQILTDMMYTSDPVPGLGQTLVGLALDPAQAPTDGLAPGDTVTVIAVPGDSAAADGARALDHPVVLAEPAIVYAVRGSGTAGGQLLVTLIVPENVSLRLAAYGSAGRAAIIETPPSTDGPR